MRKAIRWSSGGSSALIRSTWRVKLGGVFFCIFLGFLKEQKKWPKQNWCVRSQTTATADAAVEAVLLFFFFLFTVNQDKKKKEKPKRSTVKTTNNGRSEWAITAGRDCDG